MLPVMSRRPGEEPWGPTHQYMEPPFKRRHPLASCFGALLTLFLLFFIVGFVRIALGLGSGNAIGWTIGVVIVLFLGRVLLMLGVGVLTRTRHTRARPVPLAPVPVDRPVARRGVSPGARVREGVLRCGGGAYLGKRGEEWVCADPQSAVMILGPPRSGKTSAVMIPALMGASGAVVSTSTKPDVMRHDRRPRRGRRGLAVRSHRERVPTRRRAATVMVTGQRRNHLG
jgi:hypothetical protein